MTIETLGNKGCWYPVNLGRLMRRTGADPTSDVAELYHHAIDCYPNQDWRLCRDGAPIDTYEV